MNITKDSENIGLKSIIVSYLSHWKLFFGAFLFSLILGILYLIFYPKTYEVYSSVQLKDEEELMSSSSFGLGEAAGLMKSFGLGGLPSGGVNLDDELAVFSSTDLLNSVVQQLGLNVEYYKPFAWGYKMYQETPFLLTADSVSFSRINENMTLTVKSNQAGFEIDIEKTSENSARKFAYKSLPAKIEIEEGCFILSENVLYEKKAIPKKMEIIVRPSRWVAEELLDIIDVFEYSKTSNVVEFTYRDYEKKRAVDILVSLIEQYNLRASGLKKKEKNKDYDFVQERIDGIMRDLINSEEEIEKFKLKNQLTNLEYDIQFYVEQMKELQVKIIELEAQTHIIDLMDTYVKDPSNKYNVIPGLLSVKDGESAGALSSYNEALVERARMLNTTSEDHPAVLSMNEQIDKLRKGVFLTIENARKGLSLTLDDLKNKEKAIFIRMGGVPTQERQFIELKRRQEILQGVYLILLQKREELALSLGQDRLKANMVDVPFVKKDPVAPRKLFAAIGILLFTIIVPVIYLFLKEQILGLILEIKKATK